MYRKEVLLVLMAFMFQTLLHSEVKDTIDYIDQYNVIWKSSSKNSGESMPVGGHSIGLNLWVENGDILFYAQRSGSFTENNEYHKLGRFRITLNPNPFANEESFRQELKLGDGYAEIEAQKDSNTVLIKVWCEVNRPVIHFDVESKYAIDASVKYESWRTEDIEIPNVSFGPRWGCFSWEDYPGKVIRYSDVVEKSENSILFYHRNNDDLLINYMLKQQQLQDYSKLVVNTQKGRTFGGQIIAEGYSPGEISTGVYSNTDFKSWELKSDEARRKHSIKIFTHVAQTESLKDWKNHLDSLTDDSSVADKELFVKNKEWWRAFWERSWLIIEKDSSDFKAWELARNYQLFRYQMGCNWCGEYPTKFNGGNFTFDPIYAHWKRKGTPDWRAWGGGSFTAQNQRLLYWPLLKTGDFEAMLPQFDFYQRILPTAKARVKKYWGHNGCLYPEQIENFGLPIACAWGWSEADAERRKRDPKTELGILDNDYISYHYESQLEFSYMILEYHRYSGMDISRYLEFIKQSVIFFDEHYKMRCRLASGKELDENGQLVIYPSTACETYKGAKNPTDIIAGIDACIDGLLGIEEGHVSNKEKEFFSELKKSLPNYAYSTVNGDTIILPAHSWEKIQNTEIPQFYPLFPFNRFALSDHDMMIFKNTWKHGIWDKTMVQSWHQDGIMYARMGMTNEAKKYNTKKLQNANKRFPTFWGPGHDWTPDHNWGGSGMLGLQEMLMQTIGDKIHLLPAWPKDWNCQFKLHAPKQTVITGEVKDGELVDLNVQPAIRIKDIIIR